MTFDGKTIRDLRRGINDVVMDRPHILVVKKAGYAPHLHVIWPTHRPKYEVRLPELQLENNAKDGTLLEVKPFPKSNEPYGIRVRAGENSYSSNVVVTAVHGEFVDYAISRKQRESLLIGIYPDAYGTVSLDTTLKSDSLGEAGFEYKVLGKKDINVCLRRDGDVLCLPKNTMNTIPSGLAWEVVAFTGSGANKDILKGGYKIDLLSRRQYIYTVDIGRGNSLDLQLENTIIIKKDEKKDAAKK